MAVTYWTLTHDFYDVTGRRPNGRVVASLDALALVDGQNATVIPWTVTKSIRNGALSLPLPSSTNQGLAGKSAHLVFYLDTHPTFTLDLPLQASSGTVELDDLIDDWTTGGGGTGGQTGALVATDLGDNTLSVSGTAVTDNGDGTITLADGSYTDNGDNTVTIAA